MTASNACWVQTQVRARARRVPIVGKGRRDKAGDRRHRKERAEEGKQVVLLAPRWSGFVAKSEDHDTAATKFVLTAPGLCSRLAQYGSELGGNRQSVDDDE